MCAATTQGLSRNYGDRKQAAGVDARFTRFCHKPSLHRDWELLAETPRLPVKVVHADANAIRITLISLGDDLRRRVLPVVDRPFLAGNQAARPHSRWPGGNGRHPALFAEIAF